MADWQTEQDEYENALAATGGLMALLRTHPNTELTSARLVTDDDGNATNQIDVEFGFMNSPYRITVVRIRDDRPEDPNA